MNRFIELLAPKSKADFVIKNVVACVIGGCGAKLAMYVFPSIQEISLADIVSLALAGGSPIVITMLIVVDKLTELKAQLAQAAATDALTRVMNRGAFVDKLTQATCNNDGVLLLIDADYFKSVNDSYGHAAGDQVLQEIAELLRRQLRHPEDLVGRLGGEEFGVFLSGTDPDRALQVASRICEGVELELENGELKLRVTMSVGVAASETGIGVNEVMALADAALYRAKALGRARAELAAA